MKPSELALLIALVIGLAIWGWGSGDDYAGRSSLEELTHACLIGCSERQQWQLREEER